MLPNHTFPGGALTAYSRVKVTKADEPVCVGNRDDYSGQIFIKLILDLVWVGHIGGIGAEKCGELLPPLEAESHRHKSIVHFSFSRSSQLANGVALTANPTPALHLSSGARPLQEML